MLPTESHLAKTATKNADVPPPATPMEKYKLRLSVARQTGRLDLACKAVWVPEEAVSSNSSVALKAQKAPSEAQLVKTDDASADGVFLTQDSQSVARTNSADSDGAGIFQQVASHRGDDLVEEEAAAGAKDTTKPGGKRKPKEMVVDFRLSVIPTEVLRLTGNLLNECSALDFSCAYIWSCAQY